MDKRPGRRAYKLHRSVDSEEAALPFHHTADGITAAARAHHSAAVMEALGSTLQACTGCHANFKQSVVSEATWNQVTSAVP